MLSSSQLLNGLNMSQTNSLKSLNRYMYRYIIITLLQKKTIMMLIYRRNHDIKFKISLSFVVFSIKLCFIINQTKSTSTLIFTINRQIFIFVDSHKSNIDSLQVCFYFNAILNLDILLSVILI